MSDENFQNKYRIKTTRAKWHDYSSGTYFITVCTKNREHFFGEIINCCRDVYDNRDAACHVSTKDNEPSTQLSPIGQFLTETIQNITSHCLYAEIPLFVVMPNHWHAIVLIDGNKTPYIRRNVDGCRDVACRVSTEDNEMKNEQMQNIANKQGWLSVTIGGIKSAITKFARENDIDFAWQTRFHDHIIRTREEMNRIANYIETNPQTWDTDCFNKNVNTP